MISCKHAYDEMPYYKDVSLEEFEVLSGKTRTLIHNTEVRKLVQKFLLRLSRTMTNTEFVAFMNQPSVTLLSGSEQVSASCSAMQAIKIHSEQFQWFKLVQLQNCVEILNNCSELQIAILGEIRHYVYSYIEHGRTELLVNCKVAFKIDPMYKYFRMIDRHLLEECITTYYHDLFRLTSISFQYLLLKKYQSSFIGTHPVSESLYDSDRSSFVMEQKQRVCDTESVTGVDAQVLEVSTSYGLESNMKPFVNIAKP